MRRTLILTLAVLALALAVCALGTRLLDDTVAEAERLRSAAMLAEHDGEADRAAELLVQLAELWKRKSNALEMLASHDDLHAVATGNAEAQICLECRDHDDFLRTLAVVGADLEHICDVEALRLSNLY